MNLLTKDELRSLIQTSNDPRVSIFLPTERAGNEIDQSRIRLKNLIKESEEKLKKTSMLDKDIPKLLEPLEKLVNDSMFWSYQNEGLAVFISKDNFFYYQLPLKFDELTVVSNRFHIKPLLPLFNNNGQFYVLALSQQEVRLLQCTRYDVHEIKLEGVPSNMAEALQYDDPEKQLQFHTGTPRGSHGSERSGMYHGQDIDHKNAILRYFRQINNGIVSYLNDYKVPLVLAGVDYLLSIYKEANVYQGLLQEGLTGNPEELSSKKLRDEAWAIVEPYFKEEQKRAIDLYRQLAGTGQASNAIDEIVPAAYNGRIKQLMISTGFHEWGSFVPEKNVVTFHHEENNDSIDLIDFAASNTFLTGGDIFIIKAEDIPEGKPFAAIFRY
ncbi:hypothetical protein CACET_c38700 [Clostridium aceticum]|uniref:Uncharacterized protein n=1 Tax=Clostridium aceticum TaxID=84022 RepID=A0A0D8IAQ8_9CLOT|nr:hypothetical protein [Clostridium aceticum]AKL97298.1 hypothetical protein CACET_c38700 [Clostridium aceticum]KJF26316.1 hypothetical protein TZ02_14205 [Clostridium aceticum]